MTTETRVRIGGEEGFTLIEVLVAMLILTVGLLGLEALGIGAARSIAQAETRNELVAAASGAMEKAQQRVRRQLLASPPTVSTGEQCVTADLHVCTDVQTRASQPALSTGNARVTVRVSSSEGSADEFSITSYVFDPDLP